MARIGARRERPVVPGDQPPDWLLPGVVDIHTDHLEKHPFPCSHVRRDFLAAVLAHDAQIVGGGTATGFDAIAVGASLRRPERRQILGPCLDALERLAAEGALPADHRIHLRCEISDPVTPALVEADIGRPRVAVASLMDHTPGDRQSPGIERCIPRQACDMQITVDEARALTGELMERSARVAA